MMLEDFLKDEKVNGKSGSTIKNHKSFLTNANKWKPLESWTVEDVNTYILRTKEDGTPYSKSKMEWDKQVLKTFFTWAKKPEFVQHLIIKSVKNNLTRDDILTIEDINKLIDTTDSTLYKALIAFLFESGARINEALAIRRKNIQDTEDKGMIISVPQTKTGTDYRRSLYIYSAGYIRNHISYCGLEPDDALFFGQKRDTNKHKLPMSAVAAWEMLGKIGEKAGLEKPVNPHAFRHGQATDMVLRGYNETIIRKKFGWMGDSKMIARYQHIVDDDVINATAEIAGKDIPKAPMPTIKQAEALKIADASLQLSKLAEENNEVRQQNADLQKQVAELIKGQAELREEFFKLLNMSKDTLTGNQLMKVKIGELKDYPEEKPEEGKEWQLVAHGERNKNTK